MSSPISTAAAAALLKIDTDTFRRWLRQSDRGEFTIRGHAVLIDYWQTGSKEQSRIAIAPRTKSSHLTVPPVHPPRVVNAQGTHSRCPFHSGEFDDVHDHHTTDQQ